MATVDTPVTCKQCGYEEAFSTFDTHTMEDRIFCPRCGHREWDTLVTIPGTHRLKQSKNGQLQLRHYIRPGAGAWFIMGEVIGQSGSFSIPLPDAEVPLFIEHYEKQGAKVVFLSRFVNGKLEVLHEEPDQEDPEILNVWVKK